MDKITESIAHFVGLFHMSAEQARAHKDFLEFEALKAAQQHEAELNHVTVDVRAPQDLVDYDPSLHYTAPGPQWVWAAGSPSLAVDAPDIGVAAVKHAMPGVVHPAGQTVHVSIPAPAAQVEHVGQEMEPAGSVVEIVHQVNWLNDDDYVSAGGSGLTFTPIDGNGADIPSLLNAASQFDPLGHAGMPGNAQAAAEFIVEAAQSIKALAATEQADGGHDGVFVAVGDTIEGTFVNGELLAQAPVLADHLPELPASGGPPAAIVTQTSTSLEISVEVHAGSNTLENTAVVNNSWLTATVLATLGNHVEINAVIQTNVWSDVDAVGSSLSGWTLDPDQVTQSFNIAAFTRIDPIKDAPGASSPASDDFPKAWAVTVIYGDLLMMNWIQQISFVSDNDVHMLSSSGVKMTITTGENVAENHVSIDDLGSNYDLIFVGGSVYSGNFIQQTNVLLDDDLVGSVAGFQTTGTAALSTSGNLLWNQASITTIGGGPDTIDALPDAYRQLGNGLASGSQTMPYDVLHDGNFAGLIGIRVLYVTGNLTDLQYVKQVNVLGDSDQVAVALNTATQAFPQADWDVQTGTNVLVNIAQIVDVNAIAQTYVAGDHYSDEILIQAELISTDPQFGSQNPDHLVNEAVAFLTDDHLTPSMQTDDPTHMHVTHDAVPADPMQSVTS